MPELPEVETIAQSLIRGQGDKAGLLGRRVARARVAWARTVAAPSAAALPRPLPRRPGPRRGDRGFVAGRANICADGALWPARLPPLAAASAVSKPQAGELLRA